MSVVGSKRTQRATRLRAWASRVVVRKSEILAERKRDATPPIPMALTVLETVQNGPCLPRMDPAFAKTCLLLRLKLGKVREQDVSPMYLHPA